MNKKINPFVAGCIIVSSLYIVFAVRPLSKELHFSSQWTVSTLRPSDKTEQTDSSSLIPFRFGQNAGYFTSDGEIFSSFTFPYKAAISNDFYSFYGTSGSAIQIFSRTGEKAGIITQPGFPFFTDNGNFLMLPGGQSFAVLSHSGNELWRYENYAPITAFSTSEKGIITGYADGTVKIFDKNGSLLQEYTPGGSDYSVILGAGLSNSLKYSACISGQDRQRFVLAKNNENHTSIIFHEYLKEQTNRQLLVKFNNDETKCFYTFQNNLGIADIEKLKTKHFPINGRILSIEDSPETGCLFVLSKQDEKYYVSIIENYKVFHGKFSFKGDYAFIKAKGDELFTGKDNTITKIKITRK